jgi:hypothetical protein
VLLQATPALLSPADAYMYVAKDGQKKAEMSVAKTFTMALYAGAYIAFGGFLGLAVVSNCPGEGETTTHWCHPKCRCLGVRACPVSQSVLLRAIPTEGGGHAAQGRAVLTEEGGLSHGLHTPQGMKLLPPIYSFDNPPLRSPP